MYFVRGAKGEQRLSRRKKIKRRARLGFRVAFPGVFTLSRVPTPSSQYCFRSDECPLERLEISLQIRRNRAGFYDHLWPWLTRQRKRLDLPLDISTLQHLDTKPEKRLLSKRHLAVFLSSE